MQRASFISSDVGIWTPTQALYGSILSFLGYLPYHFLRFGYLAATEVYCKWEIECRIHLRQGEAVVPPAICVVFIVLTGSEVRSASLKLVESFSTQFFAWESWLIYCIFFRLQSLACSIARIHVPVVCPHFKDHAFLLSDLLLPRDPIPSLHWPTCRTHRKLTCHILVWYG